MIKKLKQETWENHFSLFQENFSTPPKLELIGFHPVQFPFVISEAYVKMRSVQDYSVLSLLILRLFDAGIHDVDAIRRISGLSEQTVKVYLDREIVMLEHIDPETKQLTDLGRETLRINSDPQQTKVQSWQIFDSAVRVHIDPLTGSLVPQYLEWEQMDNFEPDPEIGDFLRPRESASVDEIFREDLRQRLMKEINDRRDEYVTLDTIKNGDILNHLDRFKPVHIFYRWGYLAKFAGMKGPMLVLTGYRSFENVNAETTAEGVKPQFVAVPVAISASDHAYLQRHGITFDKVMVRDDDCFEELNAATRHMVLTLPATAKKEEKGT